MDNILRCCQVTGYIFNIQFLSCRNYFFAPFQIEACNQEAVKLATFINNRTPMLAMDPVLSHLVGALVDTSRIDPSQETPTTTNLSEGPRGVTSTSGCISQVRGLNSVMLAGILFLAGVLRWMYVWRHFCECTDPPSVCAYCTISVVLSFIPNYCLRPVYNFWCSFCFKCIWYISM